MRPELDSSIPLNREAAWNRVMAVSDPALQRLLKAALGAATRRFVPGQAPDGSHISAQPPDAPFDLAFYVDVLHTLFSDRDKAVSLLMGSAADDDDLI